MKVREAIHKELKITLSPSAREKVKNVSFSCKSPWWVCSKILSPLAFDLVQTMLFQSGDLLVPRGGFAASF